MNTMKNIFLAFTLIAFQAISFAQINDTDMVQVPAGEFVMGCDPTNDDFCGHPSEILHTVNVDAFEIDKYEVNFRRYQECIDAGACTDPSIGGMFNFGWPNIEMMPVNAVNWHQAKAFCEWDGKRLPTEAEWEKAARGASDTRLYPWGNEAPSCDNTVMDTALAGQLGCGTGNSLNIGSKPAGASPYGAMDMAGNLWEWVNDWYDEDYYANSPTDNPQGPATGSYKITKGGDFFSRQGYEVRIAGKFQYYPTNPSPAIGFRCARSL
jgi:formylglycine-generating enzyme required for sulfatase activity